MIAYVTSIGESTTDLCRWSLERNGFEVYILRADNTLAEKLRHIYAIVDEDFLRVDADVIVNKNILELIKLREAWWYQPMVFDWYKQDVGYGGIQFIRKECLPAIKEHINEIAKAERPETYLSRLDEFYKPRRFQSFNKVCGLNGYKQSDTERVIQTKERRRQLDDYDFELAERLNRL